MTQNEREFTIFKYLNEIEETRSVADKVIQDNLLCCARVTKTWYGNMTLTGYTYDAENRLATAGGVTYTYNGEGNRVQKSSGTLY